MKTCVRADYHDVEACREACADDHDCRMGYYCLPSGQCGKLPDTNATLRFTHYEIERGEEAPDDVYSMTQHYVAYEKVQAQKAYLLEPTLKSHVVQVDIVLLR